MWMDGKKGIDAVDELPPMKMFRAIQIASSFFFPAKQPVIRSSSVVVVTSSDTSPQLKGYQMALRMPATLWLL